MILWEDGTFHESYPNRDDEFGIRNNLDLHYKGVTERDIDMYELAVTNDLMVSAISDSSTVDESSIPSFNCSSSSSGRSTAYSISSSNVGTTDKEKLPFDRISREMNKAVKVLPSISIVYYH